MTTEFKKTLMIDHVGTIVLICSHAQLYLKIHQRATIKRKSVLLTYILTYIFGSTKMITFAYL